MERGCQRILMLKAWLVLVQLFIGLSNPMLHEHVGSKIANQDNNSGFIIIDCGANMDYMDEETGIWYQKDSNFIETGENHVVSPNIHLNNSYLERQLKTLRSFSEGNRNCYILKPKPGKNNKYLIRAMFLYGNYDGKNQTPTFDLYLGVNYWETLITWDKYFGYPYQYTEIIHTPSTDSINVCLVKTGLAVPFISSLELRLLSNSIYQVMPLSQSLLKLEARNDVRSSSSPLDSRYKDDVYDRLWYSFDESNYGWSPLNGTVDLNPGFNDSEYDYKLPAQVLQSALGSSNLSTPLTFNVDAWWMTLDKASTYYVYFHLAEIEDLPAGRKRIVDITLNEESILSEPLVLDYLKPVTISNTSQGSVRFEISATSQSGARPILNAFEVYRLITKLSSPTDSRDVDAILDIKSTYKIYRIEWQGDPCVPTQFAWEGISCSSHMNDTDIIIRIVSLKYSYHNSLNLLKSTLLDLNSPLLREKKLSSRNLSGEIAASFSQLTELESLDLSYNNLWGALPEFLANLPKLKVLNLAGNKLSGPVPEALREKSYTTLQLSLDGNPGLDLEENSSKKQKFVIPLVASLITNVILMAFLGIWILKRRKHKVPSNEISLKSINRAFSYHDILKITDNLKVMIGGGGFGNVYLGSLENGIQVAVKLLSQSSVQGYREFQSEVDVLMVVHHRHLVSLIGYCEEHDHKALVYEYMANGNLKQHLPRGHNLDVLKWNERLQIALDAASGLDYLHNGCKPPIIHRDLKTSNILLNEDMQAKIADFGLSRAFANDIDTHVSTRPAGTLGYLDPEFHTSGNLNKKSDVYSFGIVMLELITGQPAIKGALDNVTHILQWVTPKLESGDIQAIVDPMLEGKYNIASAWKFVELAMSCVSPTANQRPDTSEIVTELKECLAMEINYENRESNMSSSNSLKMNSIQIDSSFYVFAR